MLPAIRSARFIKITKKPERTPKKVALAAEWGQTGRNRLKNGGWKRIKKPVSRQVNFSV